VKKIPLKLCKYSFFYIIIPLLILACIEVFLRYKGWGEDLFPWKEHIIGDKKIYTKNLAFYQQFFEHPVNPGEYEPYITMIQLPKPENTIRIFVFGESAALGWPDAKYSMGKFLETMLNMLYPEHHWEVYSTCFAGINSHIIRYLVKKSLFLQPDLVIFYMGNNEAHGTFGLYHSFRHSVPLPPWITQTHIQLQNFYLIQNLRNISLSMINKFSPLRRNRPIRYDDPKVEAVINNFEKNLESIIHTLQKKHIRILISTVGANLRDWPPIESFFREDITKPEYENWSKNFTEGLDALIENNLPKAKESFQKSLQIDSSPAILHFIFGWTLLVEGKEQQAREYFINACDKDGFSFVRSKSFINQTITKIAKENPHQNRSIRLASAVEALNKHAQKNISGDDMFIDSCHPNFYGTYIISCTFLDNIIQHFSLEPLPIPSYEEVKIRMGIIENKEQECSFLARRELPLSLLYFGDESQIIDFHEVLNALKQKNNLSLSHVINQTSIHNKKSIETIFFLFSRNPDHTNFAIICLEILNNLGCFQQSLEIAKDLCDRFPTNFNYYNLLFDFAYKAHNKEFAKLALEKIKNFYILESSYKYNLLKWLIQQNENENILEICNELLTKPFTSPFHKPLPKCILINNKKELSFQKKLEEWNEILKNNIWSYDSYQFVYNQADTPEKKKLFKHTLLDIIKKEPKSSVPYTFLSIIYEDENNLDQSIEMIQKCISYSPGNLYHYYELTRILTLKAEQISKKGNQEQANDFLEKAVELFPYYGPAWLQLINTCYLMGDEKGALEKTFEWQEIQNKEIMKYIREIIF